MAQRYATALVQAECQIPATGMFGHLVQTATLPGPSDAHGPSPVEGRKKGSSGQQAQLTNFEELFFLPPSTAAVP
jgi:hypothetical protein